MTATGTKRIAVTPIPYRILLPRPVPNLICPCRAASVERHVLGPLREQAPCMAMGQAAGTAASLVPAGAGFAAVDVPALRQRLRDQDANRRLQRSLARRLVIRAVASRSRASVMGFADPDEVLVRRRPMATRTLRE